MKNLSLKRLISAAVLLVGTTAPVFAAVVTIEPQSCNLTDGRACSSMPPTVINKDIGLYQLGPVWNCGGGTAVLKMTVPVITRLAFISEGGARFSINPTIMENDLLPNRQYIVTVVDDWCSNSTFSFSTDTY